jgi:hypothetical protein
MSDVQGIPAASPSPEEAGMFLLMLACVLLGGCFPVLALGAMVSAPWMPENLSTCDMTQQPIVKRCREVRGQWGGLVDGRIHEGRTR